MKNKSLEALRQTGDTLEVAAVAARAGLESLATAGNENRRIIKETT